MAVPVIMPRQGQSVESCIITKWFKKPGDEVKTGEILFSYETDKASFDMEAPADGLLLELFGNEGDEVPVLTNVAVIGSKGEDTSSFRPGGAVAAAVTGDDSDKKAVITEKIEITALVDVPDMSDTGRIKISPRAKKIAEVKGIPLSSLSGSGPNGRIIVRDIEGLAAGEPKGLQSPVIPASGFTDTPLSNVRKLISRAMHASLQNSAQLTHHMSADVRRLLQARKTAKDDLAAGKTMADITINDMVCFCVIKALKKFPEINSHFLDDKIRRFGTVHLGIAVDTDRGLMVPAVLNAGEMDLRTLSDRLASVAAACRKGNVDPELLKSSSASFTVSNLGSYGVEMFTPVLNLPQTGILGVCTITHRPADIGNGVFGFIPVIGLSLTYDHRAVDGGPATLFLKEIKKQIEAFDYEKEMSGSR